MAKDKVYTEEELKAYDNLIKELREAFKKLKCQELVDILAQYKKESNEELSDLVLSWNTYYESRVNNDDDDIDDGEDDELGLGGLFKKKKKVIVPWVDIAGKSLKVSLLISIEKDKYYDYSQVRKVVYQLVINKGDSDSILYANTSINFDTEEARDKEYEDLKIRLSKFNIRFY